jgi:histidinol-phosphate aminotransferase
MRLLDRYRRYGDLSPEERRGRMLEHRREERRRAGQQRAVLDLSDTAASTLPNPEVVNAAIAVARTRLQTYADAAAAVPRRALAERYDLDPEQVAVGNGAGELMATAAQALLDSGDELLTPWPSYPLYPELARRADADVVMAPLAESQVDTDALLCAVTERTRVVTLCNPNDPTGGYLPTPRVAELMARLPERTYVFLDEALAHFQTVEALDASLALLERFPRLIVFRTLSKAYGLPGLRAGYAVGSGEAADLVGSLAPALGVNAVTQAAMAYAITHLDYEIERRRHTVAVERERLLGSLSAMSIEASPSQANFIWLRSPELRGAELAARLERSGVVVAPGERFRDDAHVRAGVRDAAATRRLLGALEAAVGS